MESVSFTDRFQRSVDKLLKDKQLDSDVKHDLTQVLREVLIRNPRYESADNFWEDIKAIFSKALKTRKTPESFRKIQQMRDVTLENLQVKFYTAETVATLSDQSAEMRADVLEAWVETLDNDNIEHGAKVLANVLTTEAVHADMTRAHVNQVLDALRDHEDKFAAIGGIRDIVAGFSGGISRPLDDFPSNVNRNSRPLDDFPSNVNRRDTEDDVRAATADPKVGTMDGEERINQQEITLQNLAREGGQIIKTKAADTLFQRIKKQQTGQLQSLWGAQVTSLQKGNDDANDAFSSPDLLEIKHEPIDKHNKNGPRQINLEAVAKEPADQHAENLLAGSRPGEQQQKRGSKGGGKKASQPAGDHTSGANHRLQRTFLDHAINKIDVKKITHIELKKCVQVVGKHLESNEGMSKIEDAEQCLRIQLNQNKDCTELFSKPGYLDDNAFIFAPSKVFLSNPAYLPYLRNSSNYVSAYATKKLDQEKNLPRKVPVEVVTEMVEVLQKHLSELDAEKQLGAGAATSSAASTGENKGGEQGQGQGGAAAGEQKDFSQLRHCGIEMEELKKKLDWRDEESMRFKMFGFLEECLSNNKIPQLFYQPKTVFLRETLRPMICVSYAESTEEVPLFVDDTQRLAGVGLKMATAAAAEPTDPAAAGGAANGGAVALGAGTSVVAQAAAVIHRGTSGGGGGDPLNLQIGGSSSSTGPGAAPAGEEVGAPAAASADPLPNGAATEQYQKSKASIEHLFSDASKQNLHTAGGFFVNPFEELCLLALRKIKQNHRNGRLEDRVLLPLILQCKYKVTDVNYALNAEVFWSYDGNCEVLFRNHEGQQQHPDPLPENALPHYLHQQITREIKKAGASCKVNVLTHVLNWHRKSQLFKTHGYFKAVLQKMGELFYDPAHLYLKAQIDPLVEWPSSRMGRLFNQQLSARQREDLVKEQITQISRERIDLQVEGAEIMLKRQIMGWVIAKGGSVPVQEMAVFLSRLNIESVEVAMEEPYGLGKLLIVPGERLFLREAGDSRKISAEQKQAFAVNEQVLVASGISEEVLCSFTRILAEHGGSLLLEELHKATIEQKVLQGALELEQVRNVCARYEKIFYEPGTVFLQAALDDLLEDFPGSTCKYLHWGAPAPAEGVAAGRTSAGTSTSKTATSASAAVPDWVKVPAARVILASSKQPAVVRGEVEEARVVNPTTQEEETRFQVEIEMLHTTSSNHEDLRRIVAVSELLPAAAEVGDKVKIVAGPERGQYGTLIGLQKGTMASAKTTGVVELLGKRYVDLPLAQFVVIVDELLVR
eukprot:g10448.t1